MRHDHWHHRCLDLSLFEDDMGPQRENASLAQKRQLDLAVRPVHLDLVLRIYCMHGEELICVFTISSCT